MLRPHIFSLYHVTSQKISLIQFLPILLINVILINFCVYINAFLYNIFPTLYVHEVFILFILLRTYILCSVYPFHVVVHKHPSRYYEQLV